MDNVIFLSGTTRGSTLEHIGRSVGEGFRKLGLECIEIKLQDVGALLSSLGKIDLGRTHMIFSWVSMGMQLRVNRGDGTEANLWQELGIPFVSIHGDSPAYFFDRHVAASSRVIMMYSFAEHAVFRKRLPALRGPVATCWPAVLDQVQEGELDYAAKRNGRLIFLKNGKDPAALRAFWNSAIKGRPLRMLLELASEVEGRLDDPATLQLDDLVAEYFRSQDFEIEQLFRLRLLFVAQLDDYLRAVKCTRMAEALMDLPVEIRGNNWDHLDFTGKPITYVDECDYAKSIQHVRDALGVIDMSPNTGSRPHDRVMRAFGADTLCVTNRQEFLDELPHAEAISFQFTKESIQHTVAGMLRQPDRALEIGMEVAAAYKKKHSVEQELMHMLHWAALSRLDHLPERPMGSQDYFVWPPTES